MKYSIIIPHYNDLERLKNLVSTIPDRTDIEIIIIDDNSKVFPDIKNFPNRNITILLNDSGVQSAGTCRNIGLKKAKGKWLLFADSDDFFTSNAYDILDDYANKHYDIIYFSPTSLDLINGSFSNRHLSYVGLVKNYIKNKNYDINYRFYVPWSKLISHSFIKKNQILFDEIIASNDVMFSLKAGIKATCIKAVDKAIYCVTKREGSLTTLVDNESLNVRYQVSLKRNAILDELSLSLYQESFLSLFKRYRKILKFNMYLQLLKLVFTRKLMFFPTRFKVALINRITEYISLFRK